MSQNLMIMNTCILFYINNRTAIVLLNAKSALTKKNYLVAYQKIQYQYVINSNQPILLYYYGKYICSCDDQKILNEFLSSGISALSEALRSCHPSRQGKIYVRIYYIIVLARKIIYASW